MKLNLSPDNPFGYCRSGFAWEMVPAGSHAHLDYGCGDGRFLAALAVRGVLRPVGVDVSRDAVARGLTSHPGLELLHITEGEPLPFEDRTFDSITLLDVLEHVADQGWTLGELRRVLKPGGRLIVTVPRQHVFSVLDLGNLKFRFPRLHRLAMRGRLSSQEYRRRYLESPDGLVGDISVRKGWHEHFRPEHLSQMLVQSGFKVTAVDGAGLFGRVLSLVFLPLPVSGPVGWLRSRLRAWDERHFGSMNLFMVATRPDEAQSPMLKVLE